MGVLLNSIVIAFGVVAVTLIIGLPLAVILVKTDFPGKRMARFLYLVPVFIPPAVMALAWMGILSEVKALYSVWGAIAILSFCYFPFITMIVSAGIAMVGKDMEDPARLEYDSFRVVRHVLLPYAFKYIIAGSMFVFVLAISNYEIPAILGVATYPVEIFSAFSVEYNHTKAVMLSLPLIAICTILIAGAGWLIKGEDLVIVGNNWQKADKFSLTENKAIAVCVSVYLFLTLTVLLPLLALICKAGGFNVYSKAFTLILPELFFTAVISTVAALLITVTSFTVAYLIDRVKEPWKNILYYSSLLPFALPGTILGIILIKVFNRPGLDYIYTSPLILIIGYLSRFLPFGIRIISAGIEHMDKSIEDEAAISGVGFWRKLIIIIAPACWPVLIVTFMVSLVLVIGELSMTVLVVPAGVSPFILKIYNLMHYGANKLVAAQALLLTAGLMLLAAGMGMTYKRLKKILFIFLVGIIFLSSPKGYCANTVHTYSTWDSIEVDTIASAWLIKKFIDKDAQFRFYPKGELIDEGIAFDTPDARYQRTQSESTYESLMRQHNISNTTMIKIGKIVHDIEINFWNKQLDASAQKIKQDINIIVTANKDPAVCLQKGIEYFNENYPDIH